MVKKQGEVLEMAFWPADLGKTCFISNFLCSGWGEYISWKKNDSSSFN